MKIYISGKITGIETDAAILFARAEEELLAKGWNPLNPMTLPHTHDKSWQSFMKEDVKALCDCEAVYMLTNWTDSRGAMVEHTIASFLGLRIYYQKP